MLFPNIFPNIFSVRRRKANIFAQSPIVSSLPCCFPCAAEPQNMRPEPLRSVRPVLLQPQMELCRFLAPEEDHLSLSLLLLLLPSPLLSLHREADTLLSPLGQTRLVLVGS